MKGYGFFSHSLSHLLRIPVLAVLTLAVTLLNPAFAGEKLKVFILAGQSNTVGHARAHTIATLFQSSATRDAQLAKMVFGEGSKLSKDVLDVQLAQAKKLDELTGGISNKKVKEMKPGPEKDKLEIEVKKRREPPMLQGQDDVILRYLRQGLHQLHC